MSDEATKDCPFCAEAVKLVAKKCKHCGETIDVTLRMAEEAKQAANSNQGGNIVVTATGGGASSSSSAAATAAVAAAPSGADKPQGSWFWLIVWLVVFFPIGIVYYLSRRW